MVVVADGQVGQVVAVEIADGNAIGVVVDEIVVRSLECPVSISQQDSHFISAVAGIGNDDVQLAVTIDVADFQQARSPGGIVDGLLKCAISVTEQDGDIAVGSGSGATD
jgi:hypothetical protein